MTSFLTPAQKVQASQICRYVPHHFEGGRENAIRTRLIVGEMEEWEVESTPIVQRLHAKTSPGSRQLKHSDVLGALMNAGLKREAIGDLVCEEDEIYLICLPSVGEFIQSEINRAGNVSIKFEDGSDQQFPPARFEELKINTASMRADCIVSALAHCSRGQAKEMISAGFVKVNDEILESTKPLCNNDTISVRRHGKYQIGELDGVSRKGRLIVRILKYQ